MLNDVYMRLFINVKIKPSGLQLLRRTALQKTRRRQIVKAQRND